MWSVTVRTVGPSYKFTVFRAIYRWWPGYCYPSLKCLVNDGPASNTGPNVRIGTCQEVGSGKANRRQSDRVWLRWPGLVGQSWGSDDQNWGPPALPQGGPGGGAGRSVTGWDSPSQVSQEMCECPEGSPESWPDGITQGSEGSRPVVKMLCAKRDVTGRGRGRDKGFGLSYRKRHLESLFGLMQSKAGTALFISQSESQESNTLQSAQHILFRLVFSLYCLD